MVNKLWEGKLTVDPVSGRVSWETELLLDRDMGRCHWANRKGEALHARKDACAQGGVGHSYWNRERLQGSVGDEVELYSVGEG